MRFLWISCAAIALTGCPSTIEPSDSGTSDAGIEPTDAGPDEDAHAGDAGPTEGPFIETPADLAMGGMPVVFHDVRGLVVPATLEQEPAWRLFRTATELEEFFGVPPPAEIDFTRRWVVFYSAGAGAVRAQVLRMFLRRDRLDITTRMSASEPCGAPTTRDRRSALVSFEKTLIEDRVRSHRFLTADDVRSCAQQSLQSDELRAVERFFDEMEGNDGWILDHPLDRSSVLLDARDLLLDGDGADVHLYAAARRVLLAFPIGHAGLYPSGATLPDDLPFQTWSPAGVCLRPSGEGFVVTHVSPSRTIDLDPGDLIQRVNNESGATMYETALRRPVAGTSDASDSHRRIAAATSLFATLPRGSELGVISPIGAARTVSHEPSATPTWLDCTDPMGRPYQFDAQTTIRPDGVAVIRLPRLYPLGATADTPIDQVIAMMRDAILVAFEQARTAPGIVWDLRANFGGITRVGLEVIGGMPGARSTPIATCDYRIAFSEPPVFERNTFIDYRVEPGGAFAYSGRVAVVADGLAISAADYFLHAVRAATDVPIVGTGASAGYGAAGPELSVSDDPPLLAYADINRCFDAAGAPLEGREVTPTVQIEMSPPDLASGIDTQLEAAVDLVLAAP